jgi:type IV secretion system protein VirB9
MRHGARTLAAALLITMDASAADAPAGTETAPLESHDDPRIRDLHFEPGTVYRLTGRIGYQIDIEFEAGERFLGLATGDVNGLSFEAEDNHVFLKPKATTVATNFTILTDRRPYYFDYTVSPSRATVTAASDTIYALRFHYPQEAARQIADQAYAAHLDRMLDVEVQPLNRHYGYCGARALQPTAAYDDGVRTHLAFRARAELPAIYVLNDDGTESLVNFTVTGDGLTLHRIAQRLILRRGALKGCVVNEAFAGGGERLATGTVSSEVRRDTPIPNSHDRP